MAVTYGFYDSFQGDRKYNSEQMSRIFDGILQDGVFASIGTSLVVEPSEGLNVNVGIGRAWFNHTWTFNDAILPLPISEPNVALSRIDAVVLEVNSDVLVRANSIKVIEGVPSSTPEPPVMEDTTTLHQHPLAYILVEPGVTTIHKSKITNLVGTPACPFVTGIIENITIEGITQILEGRFELWFETVKDILDENTAGNLLNLINDISFLQENEPVAPSSETIWFKIVGESSIPVDL